MMPEGVVANAVPIHIQTISPGRLWQAYKGDVKPWCPIELVA